MKYFTLKIFCNNCRNQLFKYQKGGSGALIKIRFSRILENYTDNNYQCPKCENIFAREFDLNGEKAYRLMKNQIFYRK